MLLGEFDLDGGFAPGCEGLKGGHQPPQPLVEIGRLRYRRRQFHYVGISAHEVYQIVAGVGATGDGAGGRGVVGMHLGEALQHRHHAPQTVVYLMPYCAHYGVEHLLLRCGNLVGEFLHKDEASPESFVHEPQPRYAHYQRFGHAHRGGGAVGHCGYRFAQLRRLHGVPRPVGLHDISVVVAYSHSHRRCFHHKAQKSLLLKAFETLGAHRVNQIVV